MTEGKRTDELVQQIESSVHTLAYDHSIGDHAFWLMIDNDQLQIIADKLMNLTDAIGDERK